MSLNSVAISGNITRDPAFRMSDGGSGVLSFSVAVNDRRQNAQTGKWEAVPNFIDCTVFGARANALAEILHKGMKVAITGKLRMSQWNDKQSGQKRTKIGVIVNECEIMTPKQAPQAPQAPQYGYDEHIPF